MFGWYLNRIIGRGVYRFDTVNRLLTRDYMVDYERFHARVGSERAA